MNKVCELSVQVLTLLLFGLSFLYLLSLIVVIYIYNKSLLTGLVHTL